MAEQVLMPKMGYDMVEGKIVRWRKHEGDQVERGEPIAEIETEKVTIEIEAFASGVIKKLVATEGETVPVGQLIAVIGAPDEQVDQTALEEPTPSIGRVMQEQLGAGEGGEAMPEWHAAGKGATAVPREARPPTPVSGERIKSSPVARKLAEEHGVDLMQVRGTGPEGRITKEDVEAYLERQTVFKVVPPEMGDYTIRELSRMRMAIARHTSESKRTIPHYYVTSAIDMSQAMHLRESLNETLEDGSRISVNDLLVKATAMVLTKFPALNATFAGDQLHIFRHINIGIIVAVEEGLIIPVIGECDKKGLKQMAVETKDLIARAKEGKLRAEDYADATFTISNLGMYAVDSFIPIINPPEVGIVGVGSVQPQPVARDGAVVIAQMMKATLAADHRATDGAIGAQFLTELKTILENPMSLLL